MVRGKARDSEVAAQVEQIERAEGSIDHDQIEGRGILDENCHSFDVGISEVDPKVCMRRIEILNMVFRCDQMVPPACIICPPHSAKNCWIIRSRFRIVIDVQ